LNARRRVEHHGPVTDSATLCVRRAPAPWRDRKRAYKILIDGSVVGEVRDGADFQCRVPAGAHSIRMKIDWLGSSSLRFSVTAGQEVFFTCEPGGSAWTAILDVFRRGRPYISLRQVPAL